MVVCKLQAASKLHLVQSAVPIWQQHRHIQRTKVAGQACLIWERKSECITQLMRLLSMRQSMIRFIGFHDRLQVCEIDDAVASKTTHTKGSRVKQLRTDLLDLEMPLEKCQHCLGGPCCTAT